MKIEKLLRSTTIQEKTFTKDSVVLYMDNGGIIVTSDFQHKRNLPLLLWYYKPENKKWYIVHEKNAITEKMWEYHRETQRRSKKRTIYNCRHLMKHDRKKKKGSGGQILGMMNQNTVTDYECAKEPLHDFRRTF